MSTAVSLITFDEFLQIREAEGEKLELVEGEVISMPRLFLNILIFRSVFCVFLPKE